MFNEISSRELDKINVFKGILDNNVFVGVLGSTVLFQIIIVELLGSFANTHHLTCHQWLLSMFFGAMGMIVSAILKLVPV